ncbi:hypothetical protein BDW72DRAFT_5915 [Aspergillus terricola var. indicus]
MQGRRNPRASVAADLSEHQQPAQDRCSCTESERCLFDEAGNVKDPSFRAQISAVSSLRQSQIQNQASTQAQMANQRRRPGKPRSRQACRRREQAMEAETWTWKLRWRSTSVPWMLAVQALLMPPS